MGVTWRHTFSQVARRATERSRETDIEAAIIAGGGGAADVR